jgi:hypothetical protein
VAMRQRLAQKLTLARVDQVVRNAPDPIGNEKATSANCIPFGTGPLGNPWKCLLRYPTGRKIEYDMTLSPDGWYFGDNEVVLVPGGQYQAHGSIRGCCVPVP